MIMTANTTCLSGNCTGPSAASSSNAGLAVGLTFFFLLVIIAGVIIYKMFERIRRLVPFGNGRSHTKEDTPTAQQTVPHQYSSVVREQSVQQAQAPIYENTDYRRPPADQRSPPSEPEEDVYLQCDSADDGVYLNDPSYTFRTESQGEDVYIDPNL